MARWTKCNECGMMFDNYSEKEQADWENHICNTDEPSE